MSQAKAYVPSHSFVSDLATLANFPGQSLDIEFANVKATTDQLGANLAQVQRDDGALANAIVGYDQLSPALQTSGIAPANAWVTATAYVVGSSVIQSNKLYRCLIAHTSVTFATDLAAGKWVFAANLGVTGPASSIAGNVPIFHDTTGTVVDDSGLPITSVATLDGNGKLNSSQIPLSLVGALQYQGPWNASTNTPSLASGVGVQGQYYVVSVAGSVTIDTISQWNVGDTIIFNGTVWNKIDGIANEVVSVAGRTGAVTLAVADVSGAAPMASPALTGTPVAPTAAVDTNATQLATTAMVLAQVASATPLIDGTAAVGTSTRFARGDHVHPTDTSRQTLTRGQLPGETTTGSATTGNVGEYVESVINSGSAIAAGATTVGKNLTSISLTAGDWEVQGMILWAPASTTVLTTSAASVSVTTGTGDITNGRISLWQGSITGAGNTTHSNVTMSADLVFRRPRRSS